MARTRVKICGVCRAEDAAAAARCGADAIGVVFDPESGRCARESDAREILAAVPPFVSRVALFVNHSVEDIRGILREFPFSAVQLHGEESPELVADLKPVRVIKALHVDRENTATLEQWRSAIADLELTNLIGILLESGSSGKMRGGSGVANDFAGLAELKKSGAFAGLPAIILAGGLTAQNVGQAIALLRPWAVDVSSGVELSPRQKSVEKIESFVKAVRAADGN
jgi:phosphoribosylanthranilate isomerase